MGLFGQFLANLPVSAKSYGVSYGVISLRLLHAEYGRSYLAFML